MSTVLKRYRVKPGATFGAGGKYPAGSEIRLDPNDAKGFLDKLIPLDESPPSGLKNDLGIQIDEKDKLLPGDEESAESTPDENSSEDSTDDEESAGEIKLNKPAKKKSTSTKKGK